jgi:hypothetical protein
MTGRWQLAVLDIFAQVLFVRRRFKEANRPVRGSAGATGATQAIDS